MVLRAVNAAVLLPANTKFPLIITSSVFPFSHGSGDKMKSCAEKRGVASHHSEQEGSAGLPAETIHVVPPSRLAEAVGRLRVFVLHQGCGHAAIYAGDCGV